MASEHQHAVATHLRALREEKGLTQRDLATKIGCDPQLISNWERAVHDVSERYAEPLAVALETTVADIRSAGRSAGGDTPDLMENLGGTASERFDGIEEQLAGLQQQMADLMARQKAAVARDAAQSRQPKTKQPPARRKKGPGT